jgi:SAM-dependent methyltransferase
VISSEGEFWDRRYRAEGAIWGEGPSPTALLAVRHLRPGGHVLEVGFGYGRDLAFLAGRGARVSGVEAAPAGRELAEGRLSRGGLRAERLWTGRFEDSDLPAASYDLVLCHRMAHLLLAPEAIARFARRVGEVLRPGGLLCLGARDARDRNPAEVFPVADGVYEYSCRPGHRIRYWDEATFREAFAPDFAILELTGAAEPETVARPVPCYLTLMAARKRADIVEAGEEGEKGR